MSKNMAFIGLKNYETLWQDTRFWQSAVNTGKLMLMVTAITIVLALFFAAVLSRNIFKEKNFYRTVFFFPNVLSIVAIGTLFKNIYSKNNGILNAVLEKIGLEKWTHGWLGEAETVLPAIAVAMIWQAVGYYMVMYIAGMDNIDESIYEAADIDGADKFKQFFTITIPLIWDTIRVTLVFFIISNINMSFLFVSVMTYEDTTGQSEVLLSYMYKQGYTNANFGYGMTVAVVIFVFAFGLSIVARQLTKTSEG